MGEGRGWERLSEESDTGRGFLSEEARKPWSDSEMEGKDQEMEGQRSQVTCLESHSSEACPHKALTLPHM